MRLPAVVALVLLSSPAALASPAEDPAAPVREAYRIEREVLAGEKRDVVSPWSKPHRDRLMSKRLAALFDRDERYSRVTGEVGNIDGDPFIDAQDNDDDIFHDLVIDVVTRSARRAEVRARFSNFKRMDIRLDVIREAGRWVIDDIRSGSFSTVKTLRRPYVCQPGWAEACVK